MNDKLILTAAVVFLFAGALFLTAGIVLRNPERVKKTPLFKPAGFIFYLTGVITIVYGVLALCFKSELTKTAVQAFALIYLIFITVIFAVFYVLISKGDKK